MTLSIDDILSPDAFQAQRAKLEREVIDAKRIRRISLGDHMTLLFENHLTMKWQVQEMARVEGIHSREGIAHELETYNALLPTASRLSATLLIEYPEPSERDSMLYKLNGLDQHLFLELAGTSRAHATFDATQWNEERISSVQFIDFPLDDEQRTALADLNSSAELVVDHPNYQARTSLSGPTRGALVEDMCGPR